MSPSPIRCRGPWKLHKRSSEPDRWLDEMGFFRKHIARDASCLFRAVSENVYNTQRYFHRVRLECLHFMASKRHLFEMSLSCPLENYLREMSNPSEWGGMIEISAMSHLYRQDFVIFEANKGPQTKISNGYGDAIYLFYSPDTKHFDAVYTKDFINKSSFCQSVVYEILYDGVYELKDLSYAVDKMLHDKVSSNHIEYFMSENVERRKKQKERAKIFIETPNDEDKDKNNNALTLKCKHHTEDIEKASLLKESLSIFVFNRSLIQLENVCMNCLNVNSAKDLLDNGITPFPYKVAKALDPDIYRNIEFDVWSELRRELRYGARYSDGITLQVGVKCLCKLRPDQTVPYHCHIQEMNDSGPCLVFIEELGEKLIINFDQLEPLPKEEARPWAPPFRYSRTNSQLLTLSQMLQQIGNISRKQVLSKSRIKIKTNIDKGMEKESLSKDHSPDTNWNNEKDIHSTDLSEYLNQHNVNYPTYQHLDLVNFDPVPVEVDARPLMVDCRSAGGDAPVPLHHSSDNQHQAGGGSSTEGASPGPRGATPQPLAGYQALGALGPVLCGGKPVLWAPHPHAPPPPPAPLPPPAHVNLHHPRSVQPNGADLPLNDIPTLRYFFNLGVECVWGAYGAPQPPQPPPPRHYSPSPRDLAQEMQQISLHDRPMMNHTGPMINPEQSKHKPNDKPLVPNQKGNGQRPLIGPRFKRNGSNQDGAQNSNHNNYNKGHNNMGHNNKSLNNRRGSRGRSPMASPESAGAGPGGGALEHAPLPYISYPPPPLYPLPYYPLDADPGMMGMMANVGYVSYEDAGEFPPLAYYPPPLPFALAPHPHAPLPYAPHHLEHK